MAKQIVREYDNSQSALPSYSNFAVLIPGYIDDDKLELFNEVSDENDVYRVNNTADFVKYVGQVAAAPQSAKAPVLSDAVVLGPISIQDAYTYCTNQTLYKAIEKEVPDTTIGYLENETHTFVNIKDIEIEDPDTHEIKSGFATIEFEDGFSVENYCVIEKGNEGNNAQVGKQNGNQIAYELIKLGYEVLYIGLGSGTKRGYTETDLSETLFWKPFKDKSYDFRYIMSGTYSAPVMSKIIDLAAFNNKVKAEIAETILDDNGRGDVIALCDIDESQISGNLNGSVDLIKQTYNCAKQIEISNEYGGKYAAIFAPRVIYNMNKDEIEPYANNCIFPASFHYLACAAYAHSNFAEWYAVAGYKTGISSLSIKGTTFKYGNLAQNTLAPRYPLQISTDVTIDRAVNLIVNERNNYYLWGNRTAQQIDVTGLKWSHYLNIRQLCTTIKKQVIYAGKMYTFDPNSEVLWTNFKSAIEPLLQKMAGDQGIEGYKIVPVKEKVKGTLKAKIRIVPIEAVEDFDIELHLDDEIPGATVETVESN